MKRVFFLLLFFLVSHTASASLYNKIKSAQRGRGNYGQIAQTLVGQGLYFTAIPFIKEYMLLRHNRSSRKIDRIIDEVIAHVGIKQFEVISEKLLKSSAAPVLRYTLAKKYFRAKRYEKSLQTLRGKVPRGHPISPYALFLEGTLYALMKKSDLAISYFNECIGESKRQMGRQNKMRKRALKINRDSCRAGIARVQFGQKQYYRANSTYLDISKESIIWPELLFEEAWNSFYLKDYNRALGKLVTYKAPVLNYIFNPEVDTLRALSYLELCLYDDAKRVVEEYYSKYEKSSMAMDKFFRAVWKKLQTVLFSGQKSA